MDSAQAHRAAQMVGFGGGGIGALLVARPQLGTAAAGTTDATAMRIIGAADMALIPGLLAGKPRWPWMVARLSLNVAIGRYLLGTGSPKAKAIAAGLAAVSVADARVAAALHKAL
ncbi:MAG: hypothetical protein QOF76_5018 [Solirubrobacteraceae bacterium]|jgi:hypothetical protein|nr:hypothetical protein [Solirubrobacteraceae bacterium]